MTTKPKKTKGPIRTEVVIPLLLVGALIYVYFHFLFDGQLKRLFEWSGYQVVGAEVNIRSLKTSFWNGTFRMQGIQITNPDRPKNNLIEIADIRFGLLWDGLLRARIVINEMAVEQIKYNTVRSYPGKVMPPPPPPPPPSEKKPSQLEKEAEKLKQKAIQKTQEQYSSNVLGDVAALLGGKDSQQQMQSLQDSLPSKALLKSFEGELNEKKIKWDNKLKTLPQGKDIESISDRLKKVKTKDFKTPQELVESVKQFQDLIKEADSKIKTVQGLSEELKTDLNTLQTKYQEIESQIKKDISTLEAHFRIPKIDAQSLAQSLLQQYMEPYKQKFYHYKGLADKYVPPNLMKKKNPHDRDDEIIIQPHPRKRGVTYEFGHQKSYPMFWIKKVIISSQAGGDPADGSLDGRISDISSNQKLVGSPTVAELKGSFPQEDIKDLLIKLVIDNTKTESLVSFDFNVGSYLISEKKLIDSTDAQVSFRKAIASIKTQGELKGLSFIKFHLVNDFQKINFDIAAQNEIIKGILKEVFNNLPELNITVDGKGEFPDVPFEITSNFGIELQKGLEREINKIIQETKAKVQAYINEQIGAQKAKIDTELNKLKTQYDSEIKKVTDQIQNQKSQGEAKIQQSKKEADDRINQEKKRVIDDRINQEKQKAIDDLKKKFGL